MRIYFNLAKKYIFLTQFNQKERFYKFFLSESRNIFTAVCDNLKLIKFIQDYWEQNKEDDMFSFCTPRLISATKFKFDYIIFQKNII